MVELAPQRDLVDGQWSTPADDLRVALADPNTGEPLQQQRQSSPALVEQAVVAAAALHRDGLWRNTAPSTRADFLRHVADLLAGRADDIARNDSLNTGVVTAVTTLFAHGIPDTFRAAAEHLEADPGDHDLSDAGRAIALRYLPWGPAAVLAPWNAPSFIVAKKTAFALAAGAPVIAKPSNWAPSGPAVVAAMLHEAIADAGLPPALFQVVHGGAATGRLLAEDARVRALAFTGGRAGGVAVAGAAAADCKALQLELGSNNPAIVRADADIDKTAGALVDGFTKLNGAWCESPGSVFVVDRHHDALLDAMLDRLRAVRLGHSMDADSTMGPQAHRPQYQHVSDVVARLTEAGAIVHRVTSSPDLAGWFYPPVVVEDAPLDMTEAEIFGPVLTLHRVRDDTEALALANSRRTGLAGYVFGTDIDAAMRLGTELDCGEIKVNGTSVLDLTSASTQGFWGGSGVGAHGDAELLRFFRGARIVGVDRVGLPV
jgi:phenylacetaldehyde dehydrogenase